MSIANQIQGYIAKMQQAEAVKLAVGRALTREQQLGISARVKDGPDQFIAWLGTGAGMAAARAMADAFMGVAPAVSAPPQRPADLIKPAVNEATFPKRTFDPVPHPAAPREGELDE